MKLLFKCWTKSIGVPSIAALGTDDSSIIMKEILYRYWLRPCALSVVFIYSFHASTDKKVIHHFFNG